MMPSNGLKSLGCFSVSAGKVCKQGERRRGAPFDAVLMFNVLILCDLYKFSDGRAKFHYLGPCWAGSSIDA